MKKTFGIFLLALPALSADTDSKSGVLGVPGGRFLFSSVDGSIISTFMLDTQTGRLCKCSR
jgi:hypothetical protein